MANASCSLTRNKRVDTNIVGQQRSCRQPRHFGSSQAQLQSLQVRELPSIETYSLVQVPKRKLADCNVIVTSPGTSQNQHHVNQNQQRVNHVLAASRHQHYSQNAPLTGAQNRLPQVPRNPRQISVNESNNEAPADNRQQQSPLSQLQLQPDQQQPQSQQQLPHLQLQLQHHQNQQEDEDDKRRCKISKADILVKWYIVVLALLGLISALVGTIVAAIRSASRDYVSLTLLLIGKLISFVCLYLEES